MEDYVIFGMSLPHIVKVLVLAYVVYKISMSLFKHSNLWTNAWHKPLMSFSVYLMSVSFIYYLR